LLFRKIIPETINKKKKLFRCFWVKLNQA
jgi:hypothetical protein